MMTPLADLIQERLNVREAARQRLQRAPLYVLTGKREYGAIVGRLTIWKLREGDPLPANTLTQSRYEFSLTEWLRAITKRTGPNVRRWKTEKELELEGCQ